MICRLFGCNYRKIPKISPRAYIFQRLFFEGLIFGRACKYSEGFMYRGKFTFKNRLRQPYSWQEIYRFSLFYFVFEGNFQVQATWGAYIWRGDLTEDFLRYEFGGLIFGGAYTWTSLFSEFHGMLQIDQFSRPQNFRTLS